MIRFKMHRLLGHRAQIPGRGYSAGFYYCATCRKRWDGLLYKRGRSWTAR